MIKSQEIRQRAAKLRAEAQTVLSRFEDDPSGMPEAEMRSYEDLIAKAEASLAEAEGIEQREDRLNKLDARLRVRNESRRQQEGDEPEDAFGREIARRKYSVLSVCRAISEHRPIQGWEAEVNEELAKRFDKPAQGFYLPMQLPYVRSQANRGSRALGYEFRDLDTTTGAGLVPTIKPPTVIDALRARCVLVQAGAELLTDLVGNFSLPKQTGVESVTWVAQGAGPSQGNSTFGTVDFTPKTASARTLITRRMMLQPSIDVEMYVRGSIIKSMAVGIDLAGINGAVASPQLSPIGLLNRTGVVTAASLGTDGGALTWAAILALESSIAAANADLGEIKYLTNSKVVGQAKRTPKAGTFPVFVMADDRTMNGAPTLVSNNVPSNLSKGASSGILSAVIAGVFEELVMGTWGALDLLTDPYTGGSAGSLNLYALQDLDIQTRYDEAFSKLVDVNAAL